MNHPAAALPAVSGFFGKLPGAGDFVRRRLPDDFVQAWDAHACTVLAAHPGPLAAAWRGAVEHRASWAFELGAGVCGRSAWSGVVAPQYDRVGRRFPLLVARPAAAGAAWFDAAAALLQASQAGTLAGLAAFDAGCLALADSAPLPGHVPPAPGTSRWWPSAAAATGLQHPGLPAAVRCLRALAQAGNSAGAAA